MAVSACDKCFREVDEADLVDVMVCRASRSSPAEYELHCKACIGVDYDEHDEWWSRALQRDPDMRDAS